MRKKSATAPSPTRLRDTAIRASHAAGKVLARHFEKKLRISEKPGAGLVTNADHEAERAAMRILKKDFPELKILTEESAPDPAASQGHARWIIDPLDGTTNFVHRFPMFCVSIAAEIDGRVVVGVIYHPILKDTYVAVRGKGATLNGRKLKVSATSTLESSLLTTGFTYKKDEMLRLEMNAFERLSGISRAIRRPGSAALDLAYVARGVFDGFWERGLSPWDVAAGSLIVQEAGGVVTDFAGNRFDVNQREILASNRKLHPVLRQTVSPEFCPIG